MHPDSVPSPSDIALPDIPCVALSASQAAILTTDGEIKILPHDRARMILHKKPVMLCHAPFNRARLGLEEFIPFDVLELFAFIHPGAFTVPTIPGLCKSLGLAHPQDLEDQAFAMIDIARALLSDLQNDAHKSKADPIKIAETMGMNGKGWGWTPFIFSALGQQYEDSLPLTPRSALNVWKKLPEWAEDAPEPPPSHHGVTAEEAQTRLQSLLNAQGAEDRPEQMKYTAQMAQIFDPPKDGLPPHIVLAEGGTGTGKTLGYLAPASLWAEKNKGSVWISTYTKNLQRQIDQELERLYPDSDVKNIHVATRKGRENYLCLLNLEDLSNGVLTARSYTNAIAAGIMARWTAVTKDGDLTGADFPGWLPGLLGWQNTAGLADRRGECIYAACDHYHRCFIERSVRKSERARLVIANHALVMIQSAIAGVQDHLPSRYIFDEGHHLFDAADSAFAAHLTARESRDLRRWILGGEGGKRTRARGLKKRAEDLVAGDDECTKLLEDIIHAAAALPSDGWARRMNDGAPSGPAEIFFRDVYAQVFARADGANGPYSLETGLHPLDDAVLISGQKMKQALKTLQTPMVKLSKAMRKKINDDEGMMESDHRKRLDAIASSLERRALMMLEGWINVIEDMQTGGDGNAPVLTANGMQDAAPAFIDWMEIERIDGRAIDVGVYRHHVDPMKPFAKAISPHLHGMGVTSATLRDGTDDEDLNWQAAFERSGASYLSPVPAYSAVASPFKYAQQTKVYIINDVRKDDLAQVAGAYKALFLASGGGALGLFTAISRLRAVHQNIAPALDGASIPLYSQHIDEIDAGTLVDIFRDEENACLLGTDAVRDGVDVPGKSLRLIVFDRVPWPRPTILHKARREAFSGGRNKRRYDEMITRMKLKQAYGRLVRRADDHGVFVMLDPMLPSRLHGAFPDGVEIIKCGLAEACEGIKLLLDRE